MQGLFSQTTIPVLEQVANFAQARHQVLAGNLANWDVPGYRARDLSPEAFEARLRRAIEHRDQGLSGISSPGQPRPGDPVAEVSEEFQGMLRHDEGNVGIEPQILQIAKNQMQHNLALTIMASQFRLLQTAISERV
jgi:flagellar basal-body rod protein FlgB